MLEELCSSQLREQAQNIIDRTPLVKLKPKIKIGLNPEGTKFVDKNLHDPWEGWLIYPRFYSGIDLSLLPRVDGRSSIWRTRNNPKRRAWQWFNANDQRIIDGFIRLRFDGDLRKGMIECGNEAALHQSWLDFFNERRKAFMAKEQALATAQAEILKKRGRPPSSHGGVANLLKVLTKTMQESGASILSIAKMQYSVCMQAGIMLPDEFLTDVLVADQIANALPAETVK